MYSLEGISHFEFFEKLEIFLVETESLITDPEISKKKVDSLIDKVKCHLSDYIKPNAEGLLKLLTDRYPRDYGDLSEYGIKPMPILDREKTRLEYFHISFKLALRYFSVIDSLIENADIRVIDTVNGKKDFILEKLNRLFDDEHYSIATILELNNVKFRDHETVEIAEILSKAGYILSSRYGSDSVKISVKGASYIERKNKQKRNSNRYNDLDKKIDNIIEHLVKLGCGQEVIFNEIDELKELQYKLSKKSWTQLLKGKLMDMALGKVISVNTASSVYEYLTNNHLNLLQ